MNNDERRNIAGRRRLPARLIDILLTHTAIVISGMLIVFFIIDRFNSYMGFMTNGFHKVISFVLSLISIYLAAHRIAQRRRDADASESAPNESETPPEGER